MQDVRRISEVAADPIFDFLSEAALNFRFIPPSIRFGQIFQTGMLPVSHWNAYCILIHGKFFAFRKMQATLPSIAKTIGPFTRITILLVPNIFLCPKPAAL